MEKSDATETTEATTTVTTAWAEDPKKIRRTGTAGGFCGIFLASSSAAVPLGYGLPEPSSRAHAKFTRNERYVMYVEEMVLSKDFLSGFVKMIAKN